MVQAETIRTIIKSGVPALVALGAAGALAACGSASGDTVQLDAARSTAPASPNITPTTLPPTSQPTTAETSEPAPKTVTIKVGSGSTKTATSAPSGNATAPGFPRFNDGFPFSYGEKVDPMGLAEKAKANGAACSVMIGAAICQKTVEGTLQMKLGDKVLPTKETNLQLPTGNMSILHLDSSDPSKITPDMFQTGSTEAVFFTRKDNGVVTKVGETNIPAAGQGPQLQPYNLDGGLDQLLKSLNVQVPDVNVQVHASSN